MSAIKSRFRLRYAALLCTGAALLCPAVSREQNNVNPNPLQKSPVAFPLNTRLPVTLPCFSWQNLLVIETSVNGKSDLTATRFVLDTGLNACTVNKETYSGLTLKATTQQVRFDLLDQTSEATEVQIQTFQIGSVLLSAMPAALTDTAALLSLHPHPDAPGGWLGTPLLSAFQVTFDFSKRVVTLDSPKAALPKGEDMVILPLTRKDGRYYVRITLSGAKSYAALVDTGAPTTIIPTRVAEKLHLKPLKTPEIRLAGGRKAHAAQFVLPVLRLGDTEQKNFPVVSIVPDSPKDFNPEFGVLGLDFLRHYQVTINFARQKMVLIPYPAAEKPLETKGAAQK